MEHLKKQLGNFSQQKNIQVDSVQIVTGCNFTRICFFNVRKKYGQKQQRSEMEPNIGNFAA